MPPLERRMLVYPALAIAMGLILVGAVPARLENLAGVTPKRATVEGAQGPDAERFQARDAELQPFGGGNVSDGMIVIGYWAMDVLIALAAYLLFKRRLD